MYEIPTGERATLAMIASVTARNRASIEGLRAMSHQRATHHQHNPEEYHEALLVEMELEDVVARLELAYDAMQRVMRRYPALATQNHEERNETH